MGQGRGTARTGTKPRRGGCGLSALGALSLAALGLLGALAAQRAHAQTGALELAAPLQQPAADPKTLAALGQIQRKVAAPFVLTGMLEAGVGQGSFVADGYARNPYVAWAVSTAPAYYPKPAITLSVFAKLAQELTPPDTDNYRYQPIFYDLQLRARYAPPPIPKLDLASVVELRAYAPTSKVSQYESLLLGAFGRWAFFRSFGPVVLAYGGSFRKNFHRYASPSIDPGGAARAYSRIGGAEDLRGSNVAIAGNNVSFAFLNALFVSWVPRADFSLSLSYGVSQAFTYTRYPRDENTSPNADPGRGRRDTAFGGLEAWYRFDQRFALAGGFFTSANPKTEDNQSFRFPFYDFKSTASNLTLFYVYLTVTEFLGG